MMGWGRSVSVLTCLLALAAPAAAQEAQARIDVDRLPLDVQRIKQELRPSTIREERDGLHLRYFVQVYGQSPRLQLFTKEDNLTTGPVPYGAPTHQDFLNLWTPQEFRAPVADLDAVMRWLVERLATKKPDRSR